VQLEIILHSRPHQLRWPLAACCISSRHIRR
jgi:hypothetical protein